MVKKALNPLRIDYKKCIVEERLLQIRNKDNLHEPDLCTYAILNSTVCCQQITDFIH